ncbi:MAG: phosphatase PAP2 family protein [Flavobacteriaceae bacterium]|nr:phosphatase PAP2 family protein [Flavobacteriaceae bacterium]MDZ4147383.1 phosphatase PAP2 family protein [Flavobacteriaceae bacterium]
MKRVLLTFVFMLAILSCEKDYKPITVSPEDFHSAVDKITEVMIHDIFSPPVASRIYMYPNVAAYEIMAQNNPKYQSLAGQLHGLTAIPALDTTKAIQPEVAALVAYYELGKELIFSEKRITDYRDSIYGVWEKINPKNFEASKSYGLAVAAHIKKWMDEDNYKQTRTMPKYSVFSDDPSRWQPTPPDYMDGIEPHWNKIRTLVLDSAAQFKPILHATFSLDKKSAFYKQLQHVYDVSLEISKKGDESEEIAIAQFWDCNPYVSTHRGHLMFATKKITPGAHWIGISKIASRKVNADFAETVHNYTITSIGIFDAFISVWDEKYRSNLVRPETLINKFIDEEWKPILQTPPFPEYTSGHSVASGSASVILTAIFGDNFSFDDDTETPYGLPVRSFESFYKAADEAAISRLYGGIHYMDAITNGVVQGKNVGNWVVQNLKMKIN